MSLHKAHSILFITKGEHAASTRYRVTQFLDAWNAAGWRVEHTVHDRSMRCWTDILTRARRVDVVVILRRTFRIPMLRLLRAAAQHLVFDFDDAIFVSGSGKESSSKLSRFGRTLGACDQVWAGNAYLAKHARRYNRRVNIIPTAVEGKKYQVSPPKPDTSFDLVWIGSSTTRRHLLTILPALEQAAQHIVQLRLKIVADFSIESDVLNVQPIPWSADGEAVALASSHAGIAPLPDNPFTRGKCGLKILQYMAAGLPVIASPVGVNADLVRQNVTGYSASSDTEWINAIQQLAADRDLCRRQGDTGRQILLQQFTPETVFQQLQQTLLELGI